MFRNRIVLLSIVAILPGLTACGDDSVQPGAQIEGTWGAQHIMLVADNAGGVLEYDCAHGTIDEALIPDADGQFDFSGTHTRESGGPVHSGEEPEVHAARYRGRVVGDRLTLTVTLTDSGDVLGPYTLVRGDLGRVYKCL